MIDIGANQLFNEIYRDFVIELMNTQDNILDAKVIVPLRVKLSIALNSRVETTLRNNIEGILWDE